MRPYLAVLSARYRMLLQYRAAAFAGAGTQFFWGFIRIMIFEAFYLSGSADVSLSFTAAVAYVWLGQAFLGMLPWNHDQELEAMIREGRVAYELVRPVDLYAFWYMRTVAMRTAGTSLRCLPILLVAGLLLPHTPGARWALVAPVSAEVAAAFVLAMCVALVLSCAITMLVHVSLMWTISGEGISRVVPAFVTVFSGMVVPLPLFPDWAQPILRALPFAGLVDTPYRIYTGHIGLADAAFPIAVAALWTIVLIALGRVALARGCRRLVVQGG